MSDRIVVDATQDTDAAIDAVVRALTAAPAAEDAWDKYSAQPLNFENDRLFREHDAFIAGWEAREKAQA